MLIGAQFITAELGSDWSITTSVMSQDIEDRSFKVLLQSGASMRRLGSASWVQPDELETPGPAIAEAEELLQAGV
jgi:hypothetical protein